MSVTLHEVLDDLYGIKSTEIENPITNIVGVTPVKILNNNPNRLSCLIVNLSGNALYLAPSPDVSAAKGIFVAPNGGTVQLLWQEDFELVSRNWYAIAAVAGSGIYVLENISV